MSIDEARKCRAASAAAMGRLRTGRFSLTEVLRTTPEALRNVDLWAVLLACPGIGKDKARTVCERAHVWPHLTLAELTPRQRKVLLENLPKGVT